MTTLESPNAGKTRSYWKEVRATVAQFDTLNAGANPITKGYNGEYEYKFDLGFNQVCDLSKAYFCVKDVLCSGDANAVISTTCTARRTWNHLACLWSQMQVDINGSNVENILNMAELDSYVKRVKYDEVYFSKIGSAMNLHRDYAGRLADAQAGPVQRTYLFHPDCSSVFDNVLTQNLNVSIKLRTAQNIDLRAIEGVAATAAVGTGAHDYKYGVLDVKLYIWIEEGATAPSGDVVFDLRPWEAVRQTWTGANTDIKNYSVPSTSFQFGLTVLDATRNSAVAYSPTVFKTVSNKQRLLQYRLKYAGQDFPQYQITEVLTDGLFRSFFQSQIEFDKDASNGGESYTFWQEYGEIYNFEIVKRVDDRSTIAEVNISTTSAYAGEEVFLFTHFTKVMLLKYNEEGQCLEVSTQIN